MVDFRVHDSFPSHPKTLGITLEAVGVWTLAGAWCSRYLTDGYIPAEAMAQITRKSRPISELVDRHLLQQLEGGYLFVDWLQYQRSRDEVDKSAAYNRTRQARYRAKRRGADDPP